MEHFTRRNHSKVCGLVRQSISRCGHGQGSSSDENGRISVRQSLVLGFLSTSCSKFAIKKLIGTRYLAAVPSHASLCVFVEETVIPKVIHRFTSKDAEEPGIHISLMWKCFGRFFFSSTDTWLEFHCFTRWFKVNDLTKSVIQRLDPCPPLRYYHSGHCEWMLMCVLLHIW